MIEQQRLEEKQKLEEQQKNVMQQLAEENVEKQRVSLMKLQVGLKSE